MARQTRWRTLNDEEFAQELKVKFMEEAQEVITANTQKELIEELADVLEVISSFCDVHNFTFQDILMLRNKKRDERGDFEGRKFVSVAEHQIGSSSERYCLNNPEKYPEVLE